MGQEHDFCSKISLPMTTFTENKVKGVHSWSHSQQISRRSQIGTSGDGRRNGHSDTWSRRAVRTETKGEAKLFGALSCSFIFTFTMVQVPRRLDVAVRADKKSFF